VFSDRKLSFRCGRFFAYDVRLCKGVFEKKTTIL
jgi:hypothetical protein